MPRTQRLAPLSLPGLARAPRTAERPLAATPRRSIPRRAGRAALACALGLGLAAAAQADDTTASAPPLPPITIDAEWQQLPPVSELAQVPEALEAAARALGDWHLEVAGATIDAAALRRVAARGRQEPVLRALREELRRAFDAIDLLRFLDDALVAGAAGRRGEDFYVSPARARAVGITIDPEEVFEGRPHVYPAGQRELAVDRPKPPAAYPPAADGEPLGARWTARFPNPADETQRLAELRAARPDYAARIGGLIEQLRAQGADVSLNSTLRPRQRGYLMWGAFVLSRTPAAELEHELGALDRRNHEWALDIPIQWQHPAGPAATLAAAREMADAYEVVYATEEGARASNHYTGVAVNLVTVALPRHLRLVSPDRRAQALFDLSAPDETRDLSLSPQLIEWIEQHFDVRKLRSDYPHWDDARTP